MGFGKSSSKREIYSNAIQRQEIRKASNRQSNTTSKAAGKRRKTPKVNRRKDILKLRAEINEKQVKETIVRINETKSWFFEKINKIDKRLAGLIKKKGGKIKSTKLEVKRERLQ